MLYNSNSASPFYNLSGWQNAATALLSNATAATVSIYVTDESTLLATTTNPVVINLYSGFPNVNLSKHTINLSNGDGWIAYTYSVTVTGAAHPYTYSAYKFLSCEVDCCVEKLAAKATCDKASMKKFSEAFDIQATMKYAAKCGKMNEAVLQLKKLKRICKDCCGCG